MINTKFEVYKIKRELKRSGVEYEFKRSLKNKFGEPTCEQITLGKLKGLYHNVSSVYSSTINLSMNDTTQIRTKKLPMILCLYDDVASLDLQVGDIIEINKKVFRVIGFTNVQEWNLVSDISLEVIDNGISAGL